MYGIVPEHTHDTDPKLANQVRDLEHEVDRLENRLRTLEIEYGTLERRVSQFEVRLSNVETHTHDQSDINWDSEDDKRHNLEFEPDEEGPPIEEYDPGPEVDDEGGMSEYRAPAPGEHGYMGEWS